MKELFEDVIFHGQVDINEAINIDKPINGVKEFVALVTQTSTNAPVLTIIKNQFGITPSLVRSAAGWYRINFDGGDTVLELGKTITLITTGESASQGVVHARRGNDTTVYIFSYDMAGNSADDKVTKASLLVQVYE
jgi:hypothetical protein